MDDNTLVKLCESQGCIQFVFSAYFVFFFPIDFSWFLAYGGVFIRQIRQYMLRLLRKIERHFQCLFFMLCRIYMYCFTCIVALASVCQSLYFNSSPSILLSSVSTFISIFGIKEHFSKLDGLKMCCPRNTAYYSIHIESRPTPVYGSSHNLLQSWVRVTAYYSIHIESRPIPVKWSSHSSFFFFSQHISFLSRLI